MTDILKNRINQALWIERYRPSLDEIILPADLLNIVMKMVNSGIMQNMLLSGPAGTGKTSLAIAICEAMNLDYTILNGSDGSINIEFLRDELGELATTASLEGRNGNFRVVIIDEADYLRAQDIQPALRRAMEKYQGLRFILTCNYPQRIIQPIRESRLVNIDYRFTKEEQNTLVRKFAVRCTQILKENNVSYDVDSLKEVIIKYYPDQRRILNELQFYANNNGCIDQGMVEHLKSSIEVLFNAIKSKDFQEMKTWVVNHETSDFFNDAFKNGEKYLPKELMPRWIMTLGEYQKYHNTVPNRDLNVLACIVEFAASV